MIDEKELHFKLEPVNPNQIKHIKITKIKKPRINKVIIPKIKPVDKIYGFRKNVLTNDYDKVDEKEIEYLKKLGLKPIETDYIQDIYRRMKKENEQK